MQSIKKIYSNSKFHLFFIIFTAFIINFYFGFRGVNIIDSFQTFDSGFRVLNGDLPFKDYMVRDGALIDILQAFFYGVLGVNWSAFVFHASIFNSIFAVSVFFFGRLFEIKNYENLILSISAGFLMYPAAGTPQIDHHSLILSFASLTFFLFLIKKEKYKFLFVVPILYILIFFIKPVPAFYFAILIFLISILLLIQGNKKVIIHQILGSILGLIILFVLISMAGISFADIYAQTFKLSFGTYNSRIEEWKLTSFFLAPLKIKYLLFLILPSLLFLYYDMQKIKNKKSFINSNIWIIYLLLFGLFLILALHESYTWNQAVTFAMLPVFSVLLIFSCKEKKIIRIILYFISLVAFVRLLRLDLIYISAIPIVFLIFLRFKKNFHSYIDVKKLILLYTVIASLVYFEKLIVNREWQDIYQANWQKSYDGEKIDKKFKGLKWLSNFKNTNNEINEIKDNISYLKSNKINSIIITHTQIYNVLLNKKNFSPVKYWWKENTYPNKNIVAKEKFDLFFKQKINQNKVKNVIILSDSAIGDFNKKDFKWLINCTQVDKKNSNEFREVLLVFKKC